MYLLDTHVFIGLVNGDVVFPSRVLETIQDKRNRLFLSTASVWEMQLKQQLGKLTFQRDA